MSKKKNRVWSGVIVIALLLVFIQIDLINIFSPNKYLQKYGGYESGLLSSYKVSFALKMGANPNLKIGGDPDGQTPFFVSYVLEKNNLVSLMLPHMECKNLKEVLDNEERYTGYEKISKEYNSRCES